MSRLLRSLALLVAPLALAAQAPAATRRPEPSGERPTVVIVVRHAERGTEPANDPTLTPAGTDRAMLLLEALRHAQVDVVIHTPRVRTRDTALPTAQFFGITPEVVPLTPGASHIEAVAAAVRRHPGKTILVVGHSNTIMQIIGALGGPSRGDLCDHQYDGLYTLVLGSDGARLVEGRYGPPNPPAAPGCAAMSAPTMRP